ncbi:MAG: biosynthetic-type acetolactate synthase large subunit [Armatimonadetes bacterium]|nr:biosynthetic-type acetolactate synthase large subunit [Armatimonadota bacterium]
MNGANALIQSLVDQGVEIIFGIPGGVMIPIYDALYGRDDIRNMLMRHEQGASHAADGYARATGKVGVCFATSGPGATNLVTGLATAYMDSVPVLAVTGQVRTTALGKDSFQEADITGITLPVTKHNYLVKDVNDLPRVIAEAIYVASTGRPGPVLVDIPMDVSLASIDYQPVKEVRIRSYSPEVEIDEESIENAAKLITEAERPVLYVGGGIMASGASEELTKLSEKTHILVATTLLGKGAISEYHPHCLGMLGMHGTAYANHAVDKCDLLIAVGARFDDRVTGKLAVFAKKAKVIHIDIDPAEIGKTVQVDVSIVGDCKEVLRRLTAKVAKRKETDWNKQIMHWRNEFALQCPTDGQFAPQCVISRLSEITNGEAIIVTDVGQHQMFTALYYKVTTPRRFLSSGGLGTMGYGFPAAIGAQVGCPDTPVFAICGDGGFQMTLQELAPAMEHKLPVKIMILNNRYLGMVRQWQELFWNHRYSGVDISFQPDFVKLAEAYGCVGIRVEKMSEVDGAIEKAMEINDRPVILDFRVNREENVFPMIPAGQSIEEMMVNRPK